MPQRHRMAYVYGVLVALLLLTALAALSTGHAELSDVRLRSTLVQLRLGRLAGAFIAGSALAVGGVLVQGLFRNPLASPDVLGTTAGAAFGGKLAMLVYEGVAISVPTTLTFLTPEMFVPVGCILGAFASLLILLVVDRSRDDLVVLLLTGFLLSSLFMSMSGFVTALAQERWELGRAIVAFALGDVSGVGPRQIVLATPLLMGSVVAAWMWGRSLDVLLSGEDEAASLGVDVASVRLWVVVWTAILAGAAVAIGGTVGFVGLIVPHALRPFVGSQHRRLIPAAALLGGIFLAACDVLARSLPSRSEIPLGVVTGLIGAPLFMILLLKMRHQVRHG